jgi:hypothetical protein
MTEADGTPGINLRLRLVRFVLTSRWPSTTLRFRHPLRRSAATFALSTTEEFEHQDRLLDVFPFGSEFHHFI